MRIRTIEELQDKLDEDFGWRRKELSQIYTRVQSAKYPSLNTELRIGIVMLYAHWEGFIKNISQYYIYYVSQKRLNYSELKDNFVALELINILERRGRHVDKSPHMKAVNFIRYGLKRRSNIRCDIDTKSNLNSDVFEDILLQVGIEYRSYSTKAKLIDERLLHNRNTIAHGHHLVIDRSDFNVLFDEILAIMVELKAEITNHAVTRMYMA